jgi:cell division protein FtsW (lipid II flippase)
VVRERVDVWQDPWAHASHEGYQVVQGMIAFGEGGVFGTGLGYGYPHYVPAVYTDYIFAATGEEMGLLGTAGLVALFLLLAFRGLHVAVAARDPFDQLLAAGLTATISLQALLIMAGNLRLMPLTGIALPFVSYGGSSLLVNFVAVGLLLRISAQQEPDEA